MPRRKKDSRWNDIDGGSAFVIPYTLLRHENFRRMSPFAVKLLTDLARQYSGFNNGYLCCAWTLMKDEGWRSETTVRAAMLELEHYRLIIRTRQGGKNLANLHALTWRRIDDKVDAPLEIQPTVKPLDSWKEKVPDFERSSGERRAGKAGRKPLKAAA
ncbi:hypothetical protein [Pseudoxanthomonas indica]|uniref:Uncharacterized protein n=1 Tax=Pseudoxanthomonas indica TaxID=428993 RepID=A0A1T5LWD4_9GAMM|nr:hypothetical protein [Pseudoxanthomonas indica]GGD40688.1 hypothetical protein GCM10007235_10910 [Pseudoxanthomonas indica]SKC80144.1 hypothetical protein SAMN06296058_3222 [Pseudoxanthomonas indica]